MLIPAKRDRDARESLTTAYHVSTVSGAEVLSYLENGVLKVDHKDRAAELFAMPRELALPT